MREIEITVTDELRPDLVRTVEEGLSRSSKDAPPRNYRPLGVFAKNVCGDLLGGLTGSTYWEWLNVQLLWVAEESRGTKLGRTLMYRAEDEARSRGCNNAVVDTFSFQARGFYEKLGYKVFATLEDFPSGEQRFYLKKKLV